MHLWYLLDWSSAKIHRKVRSTLAAEAAGASRAYDRACFTRCLIYEIECGKDGHWTEMCKQVPFGLGTDCKSLYDVATKLGSLPDERRVALDMLDVKEGVEEFGDLVRWVPTDHMLADAFTKNMPPDLLLQYLKTGIYSFKYDDKIKDTKREIAKERKVIRDGKIQLKTDSVNRPHSTTTTTPGGGKVTPSVAVRTPSTPTGSGQRSWLASRWAVRP